MLKNMINFAKRKQRIKFTLSWLITFQKNDYFQVLFLTWGMHQRTKFFWSAGMRLSCQTSGPSGERQPRPHTARPGQPLARFRCSARTGWCFPVKYRTWYGVRSTHPQCRRKDSFRRLCRSWPRTRSSRNWRYCSWFCCGKNKQL